MKKKQKSTEAHLKEAYIHIEDAKKILQQLLKSNRLPGISDFRTEETTRDTIERSLRALYEVPLDFDEDDEDYDDDEDDGE